MWSAIPKSIELLLRRSRLRVQLAWAVANDPVASDVSAPHARALRVDVVNPVGHDIPIDAVALRCGSHEIPVDHVLCATCSMEESVIPARDRCQYWFSQIALGRQFLATGLSGTQPIWAVVRHSTGRRNTSNQIQVDLEILRLWLWIENNRSPEASLPDGQHLIGTPRYSS